MRLLAQLIGTLLVVGLIVSYWWLIMLAALTVAGFYIARWACREHRSALAAQRARVAQLAARADEQHRQVMQGDDRGVFGDYPPAAL